MNPRIAAVEEHKDILANLKAIKGEPFVEIVTTTFAMRTLAGCIALVCMENKVSTQDTDLLRTASTEVLSRAVSALMRAHKIPDAEAPDILKWVDQLIESSKKHA